jgi:hypothetical protein
MISNVTPVNSTPNPANDLPTWALEALVQAQTIIDAVETQPGANLQDLLKLSDELLPLGGKLNSGQITPQQFSDQLSGIISRAMKDGTPPSEK